MAPTIRLFGRWAYMAPLICTLQLVCISYAPASGADIITDIPTIKSYWANLREYMDVPENNFGVQYTGLPAGCQVEQVQVLHRHAARYPSSDENEVILAFVKKVKSRPANALFSGPLKFLNKWSSQVGNNLLLGAGVSMAHESGTTIWSRYGRLLHNAAPGQTSYNETNQKQPLLRCNALSRVLDTTISWADGFFGQYNATSKYSLLRIPFSSLENSTLSAFLSCSHYFSPNASLHKSQPSLVAYVPLYLDDAVVRLSSYVPSQLNLTEEDTFAMQALCTYEYYALSSSEFCRLFTLDEWKGFEYLYDSFMYNIVAFGSPAGRAIGIGILQEILARLQNQYIESSNSSVNSTMDSSATTFPLDQKLYFDGTNDFTIIAALTAMSLDYFRKPLPLSYPPPSNRRFRLSQITPYAGRLITEKIGCVSPSPTARRRSVTQYTNAAYGYSASSATYKFVRMRLNNGILPLNTIRGGQCQVSGRTDGLCPLNRFVASQRDASRLANYQFICFGNYTYNSDYFTGDGNYFPPSA